MIVVMYNGNATFGWNDGEEERGGGWGVYNKNSHDLDFPYILADFLA